MLEDLTFLEERKLSKRNAKVKSLADKFIDSDNQLKEISIYLKNMHSKGYDSDLFRKRSASEIIEDNYLTGCTDTALVFVTLSRELGIPAKLVDTFYEPWIKFKPSKKNLENAELFREKHKDYLKKIDEKLDNKEITLEKATLEVYDNWLDFCNDSSVPIKLIEPLLRNNLKTVEGHVFADVFVDGEWKKYEPKGGFIPNKEYILESRGKHIEIGKGLDSSEIFIRNPNTKKYDKKPKNLQSLSSLKELIPLFRN